MQYKYKLFLALVASLMLALLSACGGDSSHEAADNFVPPDKSIQSIAKLAEAAPDECWKQYSGDEGNFPPAPSVPVNGSCAAGQPKTNESYIWGMTKTDDRLWFGTAANVECLVIGTYLDYASNPIIFDTQTKTSLNDVFSTPTIPYVQVCEFGRSWVKAANGALPSALGDWRPPTIFSYRDGEGLVARTAQVTGPNNDTQRLRSTLGLRSAGNKDGIAFLAGPNIPGDKIFIFAFRQSDGEYLGSHELLGYSNIRKWKVLYGDLYTAVTLSNARADTLYAPNGNYKHGRILKWVGTAANPFQGPGGTAPFVEVGELNGGGSELSEYGSNRIAVSTWPGGVDGSGALNLRKIKPAGISISVPVPAGGLSDAASASNFNEVFTFADYDPDLARAFTYGGGALAYFDGWLVWGSMHVPFTNILALSNTYSYRGLVSSNTQCRDILDPGYAADRQDSDSSPQSECGEQSSINRPTCIKSIYDDPATAAGVKANYDACLLQLTNEYLPDYREATKDMATSIFRGRNLETFAPQIDVLYGYETLKVLYTDSLVDLDALQKATASTRRSWQTRNNGIGRPVFGAAGIGSYDTATCDPATSPTPCRSLGNPKNNYTWEMGVVGKRLYLGTMDQTATLDPLNSQAGADLYSFTSAKRAAVQEDATGLGNSYNYGFRTLLTEEPGTLYIGTANPFNLVADGGWELLKIRVAP